MKKIVIATNMLAPYWIDVYNRIRALGHDLTICIATENEPNRSYRPDYSQINFEIIQNRTLTVDLTSFCLKTSYLHLQYGLWRDLRLLKPNLIISTELGFRTLLSVAFSKIYQIPIIIWICATPHTERQNSRIRELWRRFIVRFADLIFTNMSEGKQYVKSLNVSSELIYQTPYTLDIEKYIKLRNIIKQQIMVGHSERKRLRCLYVGQIIPRKGISQLINTLVLLPEQVKLKLQMLFVGGKLPLTYQQILNDNKIDFRQYAFVDGLDLYRFYVNSDFFIFPTLEDEWGIVLHEAAAFGLPIVASKWAGATIELVEDGVNGIIVDPIRTKEFSDLLLSFIGEFKQNSSNYSVQSFKKAQRIDINYTIDNMNKALNTIINKYN